MRSDVALLLSCALVLLPSCAEDSGAAPEDHVAEWIERCEEQTTQTQCNAIEPAMIGDETWWCQPVSLVQADVDTCVEERIDSHCFAANDTPSDTQYLYSDEMGDWLVDIIDPMDERMTLHSDIITACGTEAICACAGMTEDDPGQ